VGIAQFGFTVNTLRSTLLGFFMTKNAYYKETILLIMR